MRKMSRLTVALAGLLGAVLIVPPQSAVGGSIASDASDSQAQRHVVYQDFDSWRDFRRGDAAGLRVSPLGAISISHPVGTRNYTDPFGDGSSTTYDFSTWRSPFVAPGFDYTELIASWNARTPGDSWIEIEVRGHATDTGELSKWYVLGRWAAGDEHLKRTTVSDQGNDLATVFVDTLATRDGRSLGDWQLRVRLYRAAGTTVSPRVGLVSAMASNLPDAETVPVSPSGGAEGIVLDVPTYSQELHLGEYPEYDGGGEAWCSPTATAMVLDYWRSGPDADDYDWVDPAFQDPQVDHAARYTFDYDYDGAGNWPFNTAYAATFGLEGFVTRLRSLTEAEQFIKRGIPLVVSLSWEEGELDGAGYSTNGHLMVVVGFDEDGDVVVNDPASHLIPTNDEVRFTYDREQFENAWIPHSGGVAYVMRPWWWPLPPAPDEANW
jgi:Peptidase_C39 like family